MPAASRGTTPPRPRIQRGAEKPCPGPLIRGHALGRLTVQAPSVAIPVIRRTSGTLWATPPGNASTRARQRAAGGDAAGPSGKPLASVHTDWLRNRLTVSGPAGEIVRLRASLHTVARVDGKNHPNLISTCLRQVS
jgi:hypothetical protein